MHLSGVPLPARSAAALMGCLQTIQDSGKTSQQECLCQRQAFQESMLVALQAWAHSLAPAMSRPQHPLEQLESASAGCNAHPSCPPASRRPPPAAVPCALRGSPQAPNLLRLNRKKRDQFGPASHPSCMFEATGAVWKRRRKPVATEKHAALKQQQFETARAKVSRQRWNRAASTTSSAPQAQRHPNRTAAAHWRLGIASDSVQDAAEQRQRLDPAGHNLRSS